MILWSRSTGCSALHYTTYTNTFIIIPSIFLRNGGGPMFLRQYSFTSCLIYLPGVLWVVGRIKSSRTSFGPTVLMLLFPWLRWWMEVLSTVLQQVCGGDQKFASWFLPWGHTPPSVRKFILEGGKRWWTIFKWKMTWWRRVLLSESLMSFFKTSQWKASISMEQPLYETQSKYLWSWEHVSINSDINGCSLIIFPGKTVQSRERLCHF